MEGGHGNSQQEKQSTIAHNSHRNSSGSTHGGRSLRRNEKTTKKKRTNQQQVARAYISKLPVQTEQEETVPRTHRYLSQPNMRLQMTRNDVDQLALQAHSYTVADKQMMN